MLPSSPAVKDCASSEPRHAGTHVLVAQRPSAVAVQTTRRTAPAPLNVWATITGLDLLGYRVRAQINGQPDALVDLTPTAVADLGLRPGQPAWLSANPTEVDVHPADRTDTE